MAAHETDSTILTHIRRLVDEERQLWNTSGRDSHGDDRLEAIRVELDQYWDLLRQRQAREEFGQDPDTASIRPAAVVEKYEG